ncbi:MAG: DoxX family membrane protein [Ktedonobacteraceae bacterium]|nr:DoxX family membrane protein [Ktedonobacteraceae bacterium]MBV9712864.1 DoxX family membrane protein [Ktedonobacteraceae bacterium]
MANNPITSPLHRIPVSSHRSLPLNWRERGIGIVRILFGLVYAVAAILKWQPEFQQSFLQQVTGTQDGQPASIVGWISFWAHLVSLNPLLFARIEATTESAIAVLLILGLFSNLTSIIGIFLSLGIWSIPEGFGGPYLPGHSTDIGTAFPYAILFAILLCLSAGRYYGLDQWLTPRLGRWGFLASGSLRRNRK